MSEENQTPSAASTLTSAPQTQTSEIAQGQHPLKMPETYDSNPRLQLRSNNSKWHSGKSKTGRLSLEEANEMLLKNNGNVNQSSDTKKLRIQSAAAIDKDFPPAQPNEFKIPQILAMLRICMKSRDQGCQHSY
jgi:hypothetical protein